MTTTPCQHLGADTGQKVECATCTGNVLLNVFACAKHGTCTIEKPQPDRACCQTCYDFALPAPLSEKAPLAAFAGRHAGQTVWIIGRGPTTFDLTALNASTDPILYINDAVILSEQSRAPGYFCCLDKQVLEPWLKRGFKPTLIVPENLQLYGALPPAFPHVAYTYARTEAERAAILAGGVPEMLAHNRLFIRRGTLHAAIGFAAIVGAAKVNLVGCDSVATGYDPRLPNLSRTTNYVNHRALIRQVADQLLAAFKLPHEFLGTPAGPQADGRARSPSAPPRPLVMSCLLVSHARPALLQESVGSILAQDYPHWQLIIVDSGDLYDRGFFNTQPWAKDPRIQIIRSAETEDLRRTKTIHSWCVNRVIKSGVIKGDLVCYLCDDDIFYPNAFGVFADYFARFPQQRAFYASQDTLNIMPDGSRIFTGERRALKAGGTSCKGVPLDCHVDYAQLCHRADLFQDLGTADWWPEDRAVIKHADGIFLEKLGALTPIAPINIKISQNRRTPSSLNHSTAGPVSSPRLRGEDQGEGAAPLSPKSEIQNPKLTLITPTRNRAAAFALCERWMARQTRQPDQWIVVNDGTESYTYTRGQQIIRRAPQPGDKHSLCENLLAAIPHVTGDHIAIIEDDDWYGPAYLALISDWLTTRDLVGITRLNYYAPLTRRYAVNSDQRAGHAALCTTAFTRAVLPTLTDVCNRGDWHVDMLLWKTWGGSKHRAADGQTMHVGFKGMPGAGNITARYTILNEHGQTDADFTVLPAWIGPDAEQYRPLFSGPANGAVIGSSRKPRVLFVTERWCGMVPERGLSHVTSDLHGSLAATGLADHFVFWFDAEYKKRRRNMDAEVIARAKDADLVVVSTTSEPPQRPDFVKIAAQVNCAVLGIYWDSVLPGKRDLCLRAQRAGCWAVALDHNLPDTGLNLDRVLHLWTPHDPRLFQNGADVRDLDVLHLGAYQSRKERHAGIELLRANGINVHVAGGTTDAPLTIEDYAAHLRRAKIVLNWSNHPHVPTTQLKGRVMETTECGACLVESAGTETPRWFAKGEHYVEFTDHADLVHQVRALLADEPRRARIAAAGHAHCLANYNAEKWWRAVFAAIGIPLAAPASAPAPNINGVPA